MVNDKSASLFFSVHETSRYNIHRAEFRIILFKNGDCIAQTAEDITSNINKSCHLESIEQDIFLSFMFQSERIEITLSKVNGRTPDVPEL